MEKAREFQKNNYFFFIDYAKAFDCVDHNKLCKILQEMGIPDHLTCLLRNLYAGQEATVRTGLRWLLLLRRTGSRCTDRTRRGLQAGSVAVAPRINCSSCSGACGIFLDEIEQ